MRKCKVDEVVAAEMQRRSAAVLAERLLQAVERRAQKECELYYCALKAEMAKFKQHLKTIRKPHAVYLGTLVTYRPDTWCKFPPADEEAVRRWSEPKVLEVIPKMLVGLLDWSLTLETVFLPKCKYSLMGVPSLAWEFKRTILVKAHLSARPQPFRRTFSGFDFSLTLTPEDLGDLWLGPVWWNSEDGFTTPLSLLEVLASDDLEAPGVTILSHDGQRTVYSVEGFDKGTVKIRATFAKFIKSLGKHVPEALVSMGLIDQGTAKLTKSKTKPAADTKALTTNSTSAEAVSKLMELGMTEADAKDAVAHTHCPPQATTEDIVKAILVAKHPSEQAA
ncbi:MAG: RuvA C-terminal domain-containing protein [Chloroflexi bacterium]|nr:RuvA C-terminal domain-containing protein [Chloroflexota bacterium]